MSNFPQTCFVIDNSGAIRIKCIRSLGNKSIKNTLKVGDIIVGTITRLKQSQKIRRVKRGDIVKGVVVSCSSNIYRWNGAFFRHSNTFVVLINAQGNLLGTRILMPISKELQYTKYKRFLSLASDVL